MERNGVIERSLTGAYVAPILVVKKKNGKFRPCMDYRDLNLVTAPFHEPLPRIDAIKQDVRATVFSALDLKDAFHQVPICDASKEKTVVQTPKGLYRFNFMPFGLKNAPSYFQKVIKIVFSGCEKFVVVYIDDILVFSMTYEEHLAHLEEVMKRLYQYGLILSVEKSVFFQQKVKFLGLEFSCYGYRPPEDYLPKIEDFKQPTTRKGIQSFMGLVNYYRSHIPRIAIISEPLTRLTRGNTKFEWGVCSEKSKQPLSRN